jgi:hypothetical protein
VQSAFHRPPGAGLFLDTTEAFGDLGEVRLIEIEENGDAGVRLNHIDQPARSGLSDQRRKPQGGFLVWEVRQHGLITEW